MLSKKKRKKKKDWLTCMKKIWLLGTIEVVNSRLRYVTLVLSANRQLKPIIPDVKYILWKSNVITIFFFAMFSTKQ